MNEIGKTPGEVSQTLGVTGATLRNYVKKFSQFLSPGATSPTGKRFNEQDIETLKTARSFLHAGMTYAWVQERFENQVLTGEVIEDFQPKTEPQPEPSFEEPTSAIQSIEFFSQVIEQLTEEHQTALAAQNNHIEELKTDKERLQKQLNYERQPWFRKWFSERPE